MKNTDNYLHRIRLALLWLFVAASPERARAGVGSWTTAGPDGGAVLALAAHPTNPSTVWVATSVRVSRSVDAGVTWVPTSLSGRHSILVPTSNPSIAYAIDSWTYRSPLHRTSDGGGSWRAFEPPSDFVYSVAVDRDPNTLYAATGNGLYRTADGGASWRLLCCAFSALSYVAVDPVNSSVLYLASAFVPGAGVYRSSDRGLTWTRAGLEEATGSLLFDPGEPSRLYALTYAGLRVTTNGGETWSAFRWNPQNLAIDPTDSRRLYSADGLFTYSWDGGATIRRVEDTNLAPGPVTIAAVGPGLVLAGSMRGVSRSDDAGLSWRAANTGLRDVVPTSLAIDPTDPSVVFAATAGGIYSSRDAGVSWNLPPPAAPPASTVAIAPSTPPTLYAADGNLHRSTDAGRTWQTSLHHDISELVIDPSNPRRILGAYGAVHRSVDGGSTWNVALIPDDDYSTYYYPPRFEALAIAPSNATTIYAGGTAWNSHLAGFLYRSDDGGESWTDLRSVGSGVLALAVDPCDPHRLFAGFESGVGHSADGGINWRHRLPALRVSALAVDPRDSSSVLAGTSSGLFRTIDGGEHWSRFEPSLAEPVHSLAFDASGRFVYVGTDRGVFSLERPFGPCQAGLCLLGERFEVTLSARDPRTGAEVTGAAIREMGNFGYFSFPELTGDPDYPEVFVKMADTTALPPPFGGHVWVFHSSLTDLDYTLNVYDTWSGRIENYRGRSDRSDSSSLTCGEADTAAFSRVCGAEASAPRSADTGLTDASGTELLLLGGRFRATLRATDPRTDQTAEGIAIPRGDAFGYFSLPDFTLDPTFPEVFVKMTAAAGHFGVFHTGLTDLAYTLTVTDQATGAVKTYRHKSTEGTLLCGHVDTAAFH